jgi:hypothetical protein
VSAEVGRLLARIAVLEGAIVDILVHDGREHTHEALREQADAIARARQVLQAKVTP